MLCVTKEFRAEIAHRLPDHPGACKFVHGHSYVFEVTVSRNHEDPVNKETGMVLDFKQLKEIMEAVIGPWDHSLILYRQDPLVERLGEVVLEEPVTVGEALTAPDLGIRLILVPFIPTAENMANHIAVQIHQSLHPIRLFVESVKVWETSTSFAEWRRK